MLTSPVVVVVFWYCPCNIKHTSLHLASSSSMVQPSCWYCGHILVKSYQIWGKFRDILSRINKTDIDIVVFFRLAWNSWTSQNDDSCCFDWRPKKITSLFSVIHNALNFICSATSDPFCADDLQTFHNFHLLVLPLSKQMGGTVYFSKSLCVFPLICCTSSHPKKRHAIQLRVVRLSANPRIPRKFNIKAASNMLSVTFFDR